MNALTTPAVEASFQLYDLRVEVIVPEGARVYCGAQPGDHFTLEGEMLRLPAGQGFPFIRWPQCCPCWPPSNG